MSGGVDPLFSLRNNFYLGAYQAAINESNVSGLSEADIIERDCLVYRSYIALGSYQLVMDEINSSAATALQAVKILAMYFSGGHLKDTALINLKEWLQDSAVANNPTLLMIAGTIYAHEQDYNEALKCTQGSTLELCALKVQIYIKMNRTDHAERQLRVMQQIDEDHTLTQLANAWLNLAVGGAKIQEASYIFQEFSDKYSSTVTLMNGKAVANMHMGLFEDAETLLLDALNKDAKDADTLANLVVCCLHLGKPVTRYMSQLKSLHPAHPLVARAAKGDDAFERAVQAIA